MNLGDPELELIDPTPNVHSLFIHFDKMFFWTKLASRAVVRWSKRMYSCAGVCSYEGSGGICDIALSEPLLKLRPRKDLIETLLHEMIHAFLFVTNRDQDRDGHGPIFQSHMHRINKCAGLNISIYHSFHDEVHLYQTHWWRCDGPCQKRRPHFGIVRRSTNRAPGPSDYWWNIHLRRCGGKFIKIKEPQKEQKSKDKKNTTNKPNADITKYITNNIKTINNVPNGNNSTKPVLKDSTNVTANSKTNTNSPSSVVFGKNGVITAPKTPSKPIPVFTGSGNILNTGSKHYTVGVTETVRMIWANKQITTNEPVKKIDPSLKKPIKSKETGVFKEPGRRVTVSNPKHKTESTNLQSPPTKMRKIEDYFNATAILKDVYGDDYKLTHSNNNKKLVAVPLVDCPICSGKFSNEEINRHLDECLNKDVIEKLTKDGIESDRETQTSQREPDTQTANKPELKEIIGVLPPTHAFKLKDELTPLPESNNNNVIALTNMIFATSNIKTEKPDINKPKAELPPVPKNNNVIGLTDFNFAINNINRVNPKEINNPITEEIQVCFTAVPAFKPIPSLPDNADSNIIDLTQLDFDTSIIKNADKVKRKTESQATLESKPLIEKVEMEEKVEAHRKQRRNTVSLITLDIGDVVEELAEDVEVIAGPSNEEIFSQRCPCCGRRFTTPVQEHLDECLIFFDNNNKHTVPEEGASTSFSNNNKSTSNEDEEDDIFDESQVLNETGTKTPCPCCMNMVEQDDMNEHLDVCLLLH